MWKMINSPIVITIIAVICLFVFRATMRPKLASEIRGAYKELNSILEDGASDAEKNKAIRKFAQEVGKQIREGFAAGMGSVSSEEEKDKVYLQTKNKIKISSLKFTESKWPGREKFMYTVKNNSDKYLGMFRLNYEFYKKGELIDCENKWINEIKILEPNQEIAISAERTIPKENADDYKSDEVKVKITSFSIKQVK